eukprot:scaffold358140_cov39-Prasinocladus_malaysianus.AAC.1
MYSGEADTLVHTGGQWRPAALQLLLLSCDSISLSRPRAQMTNQQRATAQHAVSEQRAGPLPCARKEA